MNEEAKTFISHLSKHELYSSAQTEDKYKVTINENPKGDITFKDPTSTAYGGNLSFHNTLSTTKAIYKIKDGSNKDKYTILHYNGNTTR